MAKTYRDVAIEQMIATVEEAMSRVIDWWGDLPMPMREAIDNFRVQLGAAIDSVIGPYRQVPCWCSDRQARRGRAYRCRRPSSPPWRDSSLIPLCD
jgi:hypothetical protein